MIAKIELIVSGHRGTNMRARETLEVSRRDIICIQCDLGQKNVHIRIVATYVLKKLENSDKSLVDLMGERRALGQKAILRFAIITLLDTSKSVNVISRLGFGQPLGPIGHATSRLRHPYMHRVIKR